MVRPVNTPSQRPVFVVLFVLLALTILAPVGIWMKSRELEATQARLTASVRTAPGALADRSADRQIGRAHV